MKIPSLLSILLLSATLHAASPRERLQMNQNWQFAFGHAANVAKDFNVGTSYFTYLAKAGYGDGAAAAHFDDRSWRTLDLPHDWAVEAPFSARGSHSHGYKAVGPGFPESSVGWYRKTFTIPAEDFGKRIFIEFDGVMRDAKVWVNGFYCGNEPSGYTSFAFDITEYLNYGGTNVVAVRADVSLEEGWFYEGAGIYRHVWLTKVSPLHVPQYGTFVTSEVGSGSAAVTARVSVMNKHLISKDFSIQNRIVDPSGAVVATGAVEGLSLKPKHRDEYSATLSVANPKLWDMDTPHLYKLITSITSGGQLVDEYTTTFGIRTIEWHPTKGFFLNGRHVKLKGSNNHQNHAGVGTAIPDALHEWRIKQLKYMGNNAYRMAHYPPSPALLEACDRLGMLVVNENRLMGTTDEILDHLRRLMVRDRNHPSVILWSIGNEEWAIEGNERGAWITKHMQAFAKKYDTTRPINVAVSGTWGGGSSSVVEVMGFNYLRHGSTDEHHAKFPWQPSLGTEEGSTNTTRGIYFDDMERQYLAAYDRPTPSGFISIQQGWRHYAERDYLAGMFLWTGFDYRGESTPFGWPSVSSYFGMMDLCGFPKDNVYYLKSWWGKEPVIHILPHWNWPGREGQEIDVWVYSNSDEVELFLNRRSLGRKAMQPNSHLSWRVKYAPGTLRAVGYKAGKQNVSTTVSTTSAPHAVALTPSKASISANHEDVSVVTVRVNDRRGLLVPDANLDMLFEISGPGRIIGVGNGNPTSHEPDRFFETVRSINLGEWVESPAEGLDINQAVLPDYNAAQWVKAFAAREGLPPGSPSVPTVFRGTFTMSENDLKGQIQWMFRSIGSNQSVYINGIPLAMNLENGLARSTFSLETSMLRPGLNVVAIVANPFVKVRTWDMLNTNPGEVKVSIEAEPWRRKTFNGLAQIIVQSTGLAGNIELRAKSAGLTDGVIVIRAEESEQRPRVK